LYGVYRAVRADREVARRTLSFPKSLETMYRAAEVFAFAGIVD
jgi:hypothetical protein